MAIFSPALVIASCILFILTRIHKHLFIFEYPLFFGLKYCLQPTLQQLESVTSSSSSSASSSKSEGQQQDQNGQDETSSTSSLLPLNRRSLPVQCAAIGQSFFPLSVDEMRLRARATSGENVNLDLPYLRELHNFLSLTVAYILVALFELVLTLRFPGLLLTSRSSYLAIAAIGYACFNLYRLSIFMSSTRIMLLLTALSTFIVLFISSVSNPALVVTPFASNAVYIMLRGIQIPADIALRYSKIASAVLRVFLVAAAGALVTAVIIPARRFSMIDVGFRKAMLASLERENDDDDDDDDNDDDSEASEQSGGQPGFGGKPNVFDDEKRYNIPVIEKGPSRSVIIRIAIDHIGPMIVLFYTCFSSSSDLVIFSSSTIDQSHSNLDMSRFMALFFVCLIRLIGLRPRLQGYLDGAIDTFRSFWFNSKSASSSSSSSSTITTTTVIATIAGTRHYLCMITFAYLAPIVIVFLMLMVILVDGNLLAYCKSFCLPMPAPILITQVLWVLANILVAAHSFFSLMSFGVEALVQLSDRLQNGPSSQSAATLQRKAHVTGSERRKQKRYLQQHKNKKQQQQKQS